MRKNIYKVLAATFAMALVMASPAATIDSHAFGFNPDAHDDTEYGEQPDNYWDWVNGDGGSSEPAPAPDPAPVPEDNTPSDNSSYDNGSSDGGSSSSSSNTGSSSGTNASTNNTAGRKYSKTVSVTGGQQFRFCMNKEYTAHHVYHCGVSKVSIKVVDKKGNLVAFEDVTLEKGDDGLWYDNIKLPEGVSTDGLTIETCNGDVTYLSTDLGVSGIKINGTLALSTVPVADAE